jgi:nucleosome binding factor SPN SPT16 subunit
MPDLKIELHQREKENGKAFETIFKDIEATAPGVPKLGSILREPQKGEFAEEWAKFLEGRLHTKFEIVNFISELFLIKDREDLDNCEKAGRACSEFMKKLIKEVEEIIDSEKEMKHCDISSDLEKFLESPG